MHDPPATMEACPAELLGRIFAQLDPWSLAQVCCVCRGRHATHAAWNAVCEDEMVWRNMAHTQRFLPPSVATHHALVHRQLREEEDNVRQDRRRLATFRAFCAQQYRVAKRWGRYDAGQVVPGQTTLQLRPLVQYYAPTGGHDDVHAPTNQVWRFKLE